MDKGPDGEPGTHVLTFKRNGAASDTTFVPVAKPVDPENSQAPLAAYKSVDDDAVRKDKYGSTYVPEKPASKDKASKASA